MTEDYKDKLILRMLECPASLSDAEIEQILEDDELRDIYSISVDIKAAKRSQAEIDASAEWKRFAPRLAKPRRWSAGQLARAAAILVGALLVSAGVFFMANRETTPEPPLYAHNGEQGEDTATPQQQVATDTTTATPEPQPIIPRKPIKPMLAKASVPQKAEVPQEDDIEECVRIQMARMDNDLAMQQAEAMVNQYLAMADFDGAMPPMDEELLTMIIP